MNTKEQTNGTGNGSVAQRQNDKLQTLADAALGVAWFGANRYLRRDGGKVSDDVEARLVPLIRVKVAAEIHHALADARAAIDCGLFVHATQTFQASMLLAGIEAAREIREVGA